MNNIKNLIVCLIVFLCSINKLLFAELLVFKKTKNELSALSDIEIKKHGTVISEILQKYQWPMCIASDLTAAEKTELLESDKPYAEERFIQKKLEESIRLSDGELLVAFIPTTLYELLSMHYFFAKSESKLRSVIKKWLWFDREHEGVTVDIQPHLNGSSSDVFLDVNKEYQRVNDRFFANNTNAALELHKELFIALLNKHPELQNFSTALQVSSFVQSKSFEIIQNAAQELMALRDQISFFPRRMDAPLNDRIQAMVHSLGDEKNQCMVNDYVAQEYKAREKNKALIVRGCSPFIVDFKVANVRANYTLIGNSFSNYTCKDVYDDNDKLSKCFEIPLSQAYQENMIKPYSVSFGASLFAGLLKDQTACSYNFLMGKRVYSDKSTTISDIAGYSLQIDKKKYVENKEQKLFFIPPLATIPSLFGNGEFFHPRSTAAVAKKCNTPQSVTGLMWYDLKDSSEMILIQRDPLEHGAMLSEFIARNGTIIYRRSNQLKKEDKEHGDKILESQLQAAEDYKKMVNACAAKIADFRKKDLRL